MSTCPVSGNSGVVHLSGPLQPSEIKNISEKGYIPISLCFSPRTTVPSLLNTNEIMEDTRASCVYLGKVYHLISIQVCSPLHKGYILPEDSARDPSSAECILTYAPSDTVEEGPLSGIILCLPIYQSTTPMYDSYLDQIATDKDITCGYQNEQGKTYEGTDNRVIENSTLRKCTKACCDDAQCLAYTFGSGKCHIKHTASNLVSSRDNTTISGNIKRGQLTSPVPPPSTPQALVSTLQSLFYLPDGTTTHPIIGYKTCFESTKNNIQSIHTLAVYVFPKGIRMLPASYLYLVQRMSSPLPSYRIPSSVRKDGRTFMRQRMNNGAKELTEPSMKGEIYTTTVSTCTEEFRGRFEYFTLPSHSFTECKRDGSTRVSPRPDSSCRRLPTSQYKCVPFNEKTDVKGGLVYPTGATLKDVLESQKKAADAAAAKQGESTSVGGLTPAQIEGIIGGSIGGIVLLYLVYRGVTYIFNRPSE